MTPGQQAAIVASAQDWSKAQTHGGDRKSDQSATLHHDLSSTGKRAAESGASLRTQKMADAVAKADPELSKKVAHGEITLPQAVKQVAAKKAARTLPTPPKLDVTTQERVRREDVSPIYRGCLGHSFKSRRILAWYPAHQLSRIRSPDWVASGYALSIVYH